MIAKLSLCLLSLSQLLLGLPVEKRDHHFSKGEAESSNKVPKFSFYPATLASYAKSNDVPTTTTYYAPHYSEVSHLLSELTTTTWGSWDPSATTEASDSEDPYGQYAWTQLWEQASIKNFSNTAIYSTTVEPTAVPTESLVLPPKDAFKFDDKLKFPEDFIFGVAGSASQIEGAVAEEGRSPTVMEKLITDDRPQDYITNENYYLYKQDIKRLASMGVKAYSFTIPWTRILPFVLPGTPVNQQGLDHYDDLINTCLENGITPIATLTHFDSPLMFNGGKPVSGDYELGLYAGYANETFVDAFVNYGKIVLAHYADRVPVWIGFNEPYLYSGFPLSIKHVVQATAKLHKFYHKELKGKGKFGIKFNDNFGVPRDPENQDDVAAATRFQEFQLGSFSNPLFLGQDYPQSWKNTFKNESEYLFTAEELKEVSFGSDFFGIDPYTYTVVTQPEGGIEACAANRSHELWPICVNQTEVQEDGWKIGYRSQSYVYITPVQLREYLNFLWDTYKAPVFVSEFGFPEWRESEKELGDQLFDLNRSIYYRSFMEAILQAIHYDKVPVMGALAWSFADNWEFGDYEAQFGLQVVNRTTQERYFKKSFFDIVEYVEDRR
ncbi:uncharacterized protein PRCAT00005029001 [Priceomyces carsonii]|uniref:uncharacterized protein n=1 Tax=Priceomyces carsonii TaxID=28549 RepID=UPI002EDADAE5|nr:unnamed protein product [Priceomyces carsonii]